MLAEFLPHRPLGPHIDGGERFVEEEKFRIEHQRPGKGHPLPLASREPADVDAREAGEVHRRELLRHRPGYL